MDQDTKGTKDASTGSSPAGGTTESRSDGEQSKQVPFSEHPRWKEVYGELQEWKRLGGSPTDIRAKLQEAQELKAALEQAAAEIANETSRKGGSEAEVNATYQAVRAELLKVLPELNMVHELQQATALRYARLERAAVAETKRVMEAAGLSVGQADVTAMSDILADIIRNDDDLLSEYEIDPKGAVQNAWGRYVERVRPAVERTLKSAKQKEREPLRTLPKAHGAGGGEVGPGEKPPAPPKDLREAEGRAMARLRGSGE